MRTIKIFTTLAAVFIISLSLKAQQDTTKPFYFPHKTGDMWEYFYFEFGTNHTDTVQNFTISDSIDEHGIIYITQYARRINPIEPPILIADTTNFGIDTLFNVYEYGPFFFGGNKVEKLIRYKLNANKGDQWIMFSYDLGGGNFRYEMARVQDKWVGDLFGEKTNFMRMHYYTAVDSTDTSGGISGWDWYWDDIADGFGLTYRYPAEYFGEIHLIGAVINGTTYGDTTLVSVKGDQYFFPSYITLNQNYPNPFNPSTTISFELSNLSKVSLIIYDLLGNETFKLIDNKEFHSGGHKVFWNGEKDNGVKAASGIYFYRLITDDQTLTRSMILLK